MYKITGNDLKERGHKPGPHWGKCLDIINSGDYTGEQIDNIIRIQEELMKPDPGIPLKDVPAPCQYNITADNEFEVENLASVRATMDVLLRTPVVEEAAVMPDACPAGSIGTIPVGGVVATRNAIIPGMHSADICCSLQATVFESAEPLDVLNAVHSATHFGPGGRKREDEFRFDAELREKMLGNRFFKASKMRSMIGSHYGTQGDGNHFAFVGRLESSGKTVLVTHHGSRGVGALVYKAGMKVANGFREILSPDTIKANSWIPSDSSEGIEYWDALQMVREWTKRNHAVLHDETLKAVGDDIHHRFWNEHNFVFREEDENGSLFWHAKGATPIHTPFLPDTDGVQIVPLNMSQPILFIKSERNEQNRGFAPHGAGRNMSRTQHKKLMGDRPKEEIFAEETDGLDARFFSGHIDISELPSAYKDAEKLQADMKAFGLADVVDRVLPYGSIMAGDWEQDAPWRRKNKKKNKARK